MRIHLEILFLQDYLLYNGTYSIESNTYTTHLDYFIIVLFIIVLFIIVLFIIVLFYYCIIYYCIIYYCIIYYCIILLLYYLLLYYLLLYYLLLYSCTCVDGGLSPVVKGLEERQTGEISSLKSQLGTKSK